MKTKLITATALAASFGAGYTSAPKHIYPSAINAATIRVHEECEAQRRAYLEKRTGSEVGSGKSLQEVPKAKDREQR